MENTKKLKVVRGSKEHPELVREWLKSQGATDSSECGCRNRNSYYYVGDGHVQDEHISSLIWDFIDYEVVELEEPKPKHVFQPFEKVLVRDNESNDWRPEIFAFEYIDEIDEPRYSCVGCVDFAQCIPYEGNEHLLGTKDSPKGGER